MIPRHQPPACGVLCQRLSSRRAALLVLIACGIFIVLAGASHASSARDRAPLADAPEWQRLVTLWHALLDHSSDLIYNRARFDELVKDLDQADADLAALADRSLLPRQVADDLRGLFHDRYGFIRGHTYATLYRIEMTNIEATRSASSWIVELQLSVLCAAYPDANTKQELIAAAESNLAYELNFLYQLDRFEAEGARRRRALMTKEEQGETVDWPTFDTDYYRRCNLLLEAYHNRRLSRARAVGDMLPFIGLLTRSRPLPPAATADLPRLDF